MIVIWIVFVLAVIAEHLYIIKSLKRSPKKGLWLVIRCAAAVILLIIEYRLQQRNIVLCGLAYLFTGWVLHDSIIAVGLGRKPWYLNGTGPIDKAQGSNPMVWLIKLLGMITTVTMYILNEVPV